MSQYEMAPMTNISRHSTQDSTRDSWDEGNLPSWVEEIVETESDKQDLDALPSPHKKTKSPRRSTTNVHVSSGTGRTRISTARPSVCKQESNSKVRSSIRRSFSSRIGRRTARFLDQADGPAGRYIEIGRSSIVNQLSTLLTVATLLFGVVASNFDAVSVQEFQSITRDDSGGDQFGSHAADVVSIAAHLFSWCQLISLVFVSWTWLYCFYLMWSFESAKVGDTSDLVLMWYRSFRIEIKVMYITFGLAFASTTVAMTCLSFIKSPTCMEDCENYNFLIFFIALFGCFTLVGLLYLGTIHRRTLKAIDRHDEEMALQSMHGRQNSKNTDSSSTRNSIQPRASMQLQSASSLSGTEAGVTNPLEKRPERKSIITAVKQSL